MTVATQDIHEGAFKNQGSADLYKKQQLKYW
jgi:hypothetical protein